uniref:Uncharacterized protein n=1 Tax=Zea mays TaxID=4577 RepID=A0A804LXI2_MAIZE
MHDRGPRKKDSSAFRCIAALPMPSRNWSGLNAPASAPHTSSSRWSIAIGISRRVPLGTFTPQWSAPVVARLTINGTALYSRSVSYNTMVSWIRCGHGGGRCHRALYHRREHACGLCEAASVGTGFHATPCS